MSEKNEGARSKKTKLLKQGLKEVLKERHDATVKASKDKEDLKAEKQATEDLGLARAIINVNARVPEPKVIPEGDAPTKKKKKKGDEAIEQSDDLIL